MRNVRCPTQSLSAVCRPQSLQLEPAAPVVRRELTNTWRAIARQVPAVLVANRPNGTDSLGHMTKDDLVFWVSLFGFVASNVAFLVWLLVQ